ncbi:MAG: DedA family protein [Candidatus Marinimicrobia bacterium]|jgi:membrane protein YqaA with SNARE-associated domain|nr:DedA family protein [Candidatus Neomarinimicrobiota bacterium]MBT3675819.1 DedA family protein [Candidatus Neomarinimicrobiota bacterium]MBT3762981.1 DedA family protein [Candidatus Neomarinimicrobiota bacterium]MBT4069128.1 DedA family protein [Candidatus Neomarinimicrobiota bacterium]MBT4271514.1 DedA family protein [Candidatus Neomarinimicrobiota bacterium]
MNLVRNLYDWVLKWSESKYGAAALFVMAFAEASFFPIPPDVLLIALALGSRSKALKFGIICSVGSVFGAMLGFGIGHYLWWENAGQFSFLAQFFFNAIPGFTHDIFYSIQNKFDIWNFWVIFTAGFTPIPFKVFTISAGAFNINFPLFIIASTISRTARFLIVSGLIWRFGEPISGFIDKYFNKLAILFTIFLIGGFLLIKYLV